MIVTTTAVAGVAGHALDPGQSPSLHEEVDIRGHLIILDPDHHLLERVDAHDQAQGLGFREEDLGHTQEKSTRAQMADHNPAGNFKFEVIRSYYREKPSSCDGKSQKPKQKMKEG